MLQWFSDLVTYLSSLLYEVFFWGLQFLEVCFVPIFCLLKVTNQNPNEYRVTSRFKARILSKNCQVMEPRFTSVFPSLTIFLSTERVLLVSLILRSCWTPELSICPPVWGAWIVSLSHEDKWEHTSLTIWVAAVRLVPGLCRENDVYFSVVAQIMGFPNHFKATRNQAESTFLPSHFCSPHSWQLTPLPRQVQIICLLPWLLNQRCPSL